MTTQAVLAGDPLPPSSDCWGDPPRTNRMPAAPNLSVDGFEGPLDWLLEMARARKIDLAKLPIVALIDSFAEALQDAFDSPERSPQTFARWGEWLVMAATLTELRSRLLLPVDPPNAKAAVTEAEALRQSLVRRAETQAAADWLERRPQLGHDVFARGRPEAPSGDRGADITDLLRACLIQLKIPAEVAEAYRPRPPVFWKVSDAIKQVTAMLGEASEPRDLDVFVPTFEDGPDGVLRRRAAIASTLLAGLELARDQLVDLDQPATWEPIIVQPGTSATRL